MRKRATRPHDNKTGDNKKAKSLPLHTHADELKEYGYTVVDLLNVGSAQHYHNAIREEFEQYPEFCSRHADTFDRRYVMGAFGALGNPSSFHSPTVRELRSIVGQCAKQIFKCMFGGGGGTGGGTGDDETIVYEQLYDRIVQRISGDTLSGENWHRDTTPETIKLPRGGDDSELFKHRESDIRDKRKSIYTNAGTVFGGWLNLSAGATPVNQKFVCARGTHRSGGGGDASGFSKLSKDDIETTMRNEDIVEVNIPFGHWLIFNQSIRHQVRPYKVKYNELRVHFAFNISNRLECLFTDEYKRRVIEKQETPLIPSGQIPPLYSSNHSSFFVDRLAQWSQTHVRSRFLYTKCFTRASKRAGQKITLAQRYIIRHSIPMPWPSYTQHDCDVMMPVLLN